MRKYKQYDVEYRKHPCITYKPTHTEGEDPYVWKDKTVWDTLKKNLKAQRKQVIIIDCYPGVDIAELEKQCGIAHSLNSELACHDTKYIDELISYNLTEDRVFGIVSHFSMRDFYKAEKLASLRTTIDKHIRDNNDVPLLIYGTGATHLASRLSRASVLLVYADMPRWEIQQRMRAGMTNWCANNPNEDMLRKYKRAYFIEWKMADAHKKELYSDVDFFLDTTDVAMPKLVTGKAMREALSQTVTQPFRVQPFFDSGVWGGKWMNEVCELDPPKDNYAWGFDCVPEENSLLIQFDSICVEIPSINLVYFYPKQLLGEKTHARFGTEFPIRFDFLDTVEGQNLSLQVHPHVEYIQEKFGMNYTQDESYYILDAGDDACVYLGLKTGVNKEEFICSLEEAQKGEVAFDDKKFINCFPAKKHDHFLIPAGTVHCSGANSLVLEISATPFIFTFKLWDWDRLGLDGLPRPVHIAHGKKVIQWDRDTEWVKNNLFNKKEKIAEGDGWHEERTGLHELEFIETRRHWFQKPVSHSTGGTLNVLNLVEGASATVCSPDGSFEDFEVHYAETFIIPAYIDRYIIKPHSARTHATVKAWVRGTEL